MKIYDTTYVRFVLPVWCPLQYYWQQLQSAITTSTTTAAHFNMDRRENEEGNNYDGEAVRFDYGHLYLLFPLQHQLLTFFCGV